MTKCCYCRDERELCKSHAIPKAIFRDMKDKQDSGDLIFIGSEGPIRLEGQEGAWRLLCEACEQLFNQQYDKYFVDMIRSWSDDILEAKSCMTRPECPEWFARSIASIIWRASISNSPFYRGFTLTGRVENILREMLMSEEGSIYSLASFKVEKLCDPDGDIAFKELANKILMPKRANNMPDLGMYKEHMSIVTIFSGFQFTMVLPSISKMDRNKFKFLGRPGKRISAPYVDVFSLPWFRDIALNVSSKTKSGHMTRGFKRAQEKRKKHKPRKK